MLSTIYSHLLWTLFPLQSHLLTTINAQKRSVKSLSKLEQVRALKREKQASAELTKSTVILHKQPKHTKNQFGIGHLVLPSMHGYSAPGYAPPPGYAPAGPGPAYAQPQVCNFPHTQQFCCSVHNILAYILLVIRS